MWTWIRILLQPTNSVYNMMREVQTEKWIPALWNHWPRSHLYLCQNSDVLEGTDADIFYSTGLFSILYSNFFANMLPMKPWLSINAKKLCIALRKGKKSQRVQEVSHLTESRVRTRYKLMGEHNVNTTSYNWMTEGQLNMKQSYDPIHVWVNCSI